MLELFWIRRVSGKYSGILPVVVVFFTHGFDAVHDEAGDFELVLVERSL